MTKDWEHVEFRTEQPAPIEPGWYWARMDFTINPEPVFWSPSTETLLVGREDSLPPEGLRWFGPVAVVRESKAE